MNRQQRWRLLLTCIMLAVVTLVALLVTIALTHLAHISASVGVLVGLVAGLVASILLVIGWLGLRRSRSIRVATSLSLVQVPIWRLLLSQTLPKPNATRSLAMIPSVSDLPPGWKMSMQCTSRVGFLGAQAATPIGQRARASGSVLAVRTFERRGAKRWWTLRAFPAANEEDALVLVRDLKLVAPIYSTVSAIPLERELDDVAVPGVALVWAYERQYVTASSEGWTRILRGSVGAAVFEIHSSGSPEAADWEEIVRIAELFVDRIRSSQLRPSAAR